MIGGRVIGLVDFKRTYLLKWGSKVSTGFILGSLGVNLGAGLGLP